MKHATTFFALALVLAASLTQSACTSEDEDAAGKGDLLFYAGGGKALQEGFPHTEGNTEYSFVDGWSLQFTKYIVAFGNIELTDPDSGKVKGSFDDAVVLDLKAGDGADLEIASITGMSAVRYDVGFDVPIVDGGATNLNADAEIVTKMIEDGYSYWIEGYASKDGRTVEFSLRLSVATHYSECVNGKDQTTGVAIENNKSIGAYIYAHSLHLFWDTLASGDEDLRFDAWAAVAGEDDYLTEEDLANQDLTDLRDENGDPLLDKDGGAVFYNDGGVLPPDQLNLLAFVEYAARYGVHFNGVGLCVTESLD